MNDVILFTIVFGPPTVFALITLLNMEINHEDVRDTNQFSRKLDRRTPEEDG